MRNQAVIIPALNPNESLVDYVKALLSEGFKEVIVVNDGSKTECTHIFKNLAAINHCNVLTHSVNRGKGRALKTAFQFFLQKFSHLNGVLTADADGQHAVVDVCRVGDELSRNENQLVLGIRNFKESNVPKRSYLGNTVTSFIFYVLFRKKLVDTQTGLRGIPTKELERMLALKGERYEYEINMLIYAIKRKLKIGEVPIQTIYYDNNAGSYYKTVKDSWKIFRKLMSGFLTFNWKYKKLLKDAKPTGDWHE